MRARCAVWFLLPLLLGGAYRSPAVAEEPAALAVAVLPFDQLGSDPKDEYLKAGLAETLTNALARVHSLKVVERSQIKRVIEELKLQNSGLVDPDKAAQIGKQLGAQQMVIGSFMRAGNTMRIVCRFVDVKTNQVDPNHNTTLTDAANDEKIFALLDRLAEAVVKGFGAQPTTEEKQRIQQVTHATDHPEAFQYYTQAREKYILFSIEGYREARTLFEKAIAVDERYALAWAGKAEVLQAWGFETQQRGDDPNPQFKEALQAAKKAVELAPDVPETHRSLALAYERIGEPGDSDEQRRARCEKVVRKAIEMNGRDAESYFCLWETLGQPLDGEGFEAIQTCLRLNPRLSIAHNNLAFAYVKADRLDDAQREIEAAVASNPNNALQITNTGDVYMLKGQFDKAERAYQKALGIETDFPYALLGIGLMREKQMRFFEAVPTYQKVIQAHPKFAPPYFRLGCILIGTGNPLGGAAALRKYVELAGDNPLQKDGVAQAKQILMQLGGGW